MLLAIDIGNSRIKAAVFENNSVTGHFVIESLEAEKKIQNIFNSYPDISDVILSSVGNLEIERWLPSQIKLHRVDRNWQLPFKNNYESRQTLGIDRMVLTAGAVLQYPNKNRLIIDAGTCITYDFCDEDDIYHGGAISPGISLRYSAMHNYTAKLPLLTLEDPDGIIGRSTMMSMHSGVVNGVQYEIEGFIKRYTETYSNFIIILTGGDAVFLADRLKYTIFANSNFLLESLNHIFQYKFKND